MLGIADARRRVPADWNVERTIPIQPEQSVEARPIEKDQHRGKRGSVTVSRRGRGRLLHQRASRVETLVPHLVIEGVAPRAMRRLQPGQRGNDGITAIAYRPIAAHEIRVHVCETGTAAVEQATRVQIEKHRTTPEKGLDESIEVSGVVL